MPTSSLSNSSGQPSAASEPPRAPSSNRPPRRSVAEEPLNVEIVHPIEDAEAESVKPRLAANSEWAELLPPTPAAPPVRVFDAESVAEVEPAEPPTSESQPAAQGPAAQRPASEQPAAEQPAAEPLSFPFWLARNFCAAAERLFGVISLIFGLAVLAAIPILQFISLGYLLDASGRIARTGRLRDGFAETKKAARVGSIVVGTWLWLLPLRFLSDIWYSSNLIDPHSGVTHGLRSGQLILTVLVVCHIVAAWYCGGRLRHFFWPLVAPFSMFMWLLRLAISSPLLRPAFDATVGAISPRLVRDICNWQPLTDWFLPAILLHGLLSGRMYTNARDAVWDFTVGLRLPFYFWLGVRGFCGTLAWLFIPVMFLVAAHLLGTGEQGLQGVLAVLSGFVGIFLLALAAIYLPFVQAHFAAENRFVAMFELGRVRQAFARAPLAFWFSLLVTLAFSLPLNLLKIELTPSELTWIPALVFVVFMFPSRLLAGWAVGRARRRKLPRVWELRWLARFGCAPVAIVYALMVFVTPYTSWYGVWSLFEQHAFLLPVPFLRP